MFKIISNDKTNLSINSVSAFLLAVLLFTVNTFFGSSPQNAQPPAVNEQQINISAEISTGSATNAKPSSDDQLSLVTRIIDGDTLEVNGEDVVRLIGIDTPEHNNCYFTEAKVKLSDLTLGENIRLEKDISDRDRYQRLLRYVYVDDVLVNNYLVYEGFAKATSYPPDIKQQDLLRSSEQAARSENKGMWGACPLDFKNINQNPNSVVESTTNTTEEDCKIKGNISYKTGEKIYHTPGQRDYDGTVIDTSDGERWFCSETEAVNAGWRKAKR